MTCIFPNNYREWKAIFIILIINIVEYAFAYNPGPGYIYIYDILLSRVLPENPEIENLKYGQVQNIAE